MIMLDTQASVHIISSPTIISDIIDAKVPVIIQGITGDRVREFRRRLQSQTWDFRGTTVQKWQQT